MNNKNQKITLTIISIILIILLAVFGITTNEVSNNNRINNTSKLYDNIGIDNSLLNIIYLNVGQADSTLITINGKTMLIDAGSGSDGYYVSEFLKAQNITKIDYLIGTHADEDHVGGMYKIIEEFEIETLHIPTSTNNKSFYKKLLNAIENKNGLAVTPIEASNTIYYELGNAKWRILHIDNSNPDNENKINDTSIVIELTYGTTNYLFMGDASTKIEQSKNWDRVNVLKVAHHGADGSTSTNFLEQIKPNYTIISTKGSYNHPDINVLNRLKTVKDIKIYITKDDGTLWLTSDGNGYESITIQKLNYNLDGANRKGLY